MVKNIIFNMITKIFHSKIILLRTNSIQHINLEPLMPINPKFLENHLISRPSTSQIIFLKNKTISNLAICKIKRKSQIMWKILVLIEKKMNFWVVKIQDNPQKNLIINLLTKIRRKETILATAINKIENLLVNLKWNTVNNLVKELKLNRKNLF